VTVPISGKQYRERKGNRRDIWVLESPVERQKKHLGDKDSKVLNNNEKGVKTKRKVFTEGKPKK